MWRLKTPLFPYRPQQVVADEAEERALRDWLRERDRLMRYAAADRRKAAQVARVRPDNR